MRNYSPILTECRYYVIESNEVKNYPAINAGVILSGGQAPGGHNVIAGLFDGLKALNKDSRLYGFLLGPGGLVDHKYIELTQDIIDEYRNTGGSTLSAQVVQNSRQKTNSTKGYKLLKN